MVQSGCDFMVSEHEKWVAAKDGKFADSQYDSRLARWEPNKKT